MATTWGGTPVPATVDGVYSHAWRLLVERFWPLMALMLAWILIQLPAYALSMAGSFASERAAAMGLVFSLASSAWSIVIGVPAQFGVMRVLARTARGLPTDIEEVFWPFRSLMAYLSCLANAFLVGMVVLGAMVPAILVGLVGGCGAAMAGAERAGHAPAALLAGIGFGILFLVLIASIPAIWIGCRLIVAQPLVADAGLGPVDAIATAWRLTSGHGLTAFLVALASIPVMIAGCLALCVGLIPATALYMLALASLYVAVGGAPAPPAAAPAPPAPAPPAPPPPPDVPPTA